MLHLTLAVGLAGLTRLVAGTTPPRLAVVELQDPESEAGVYRGYFSSASVLPPPKGNLVTFVPTGDSSGCEAYEAPSDEPAMAVVSFGNCSVAQKVMNAQQASMLGVMLVSDSEAVNLTLLNNGTSADHTYEIFAVGVAQSLGKKIVKWNAAHDNDPVRASISAYTAPFPLLNPPTLFLVALAVALIVAGAWFATADLRIGSPIAPQHEEEVLEIMWWLPIAWVFGASLTLVVLYFFMRWLIYIVLLVFGIGGVGTMTEIGHACLRYRWPKSLQKTAYTLPLVGAVERAQAIALLAGIANSTAWFLLRKTPYGWPFQNMIGICFLCFFQRTIRLPSVKLAVLLLSMMFVFDIFWVFVSPLIFTQSVMVAVAMGGGSGEIAPMMLRIPAFGDPLASDSMLGYGDIAIPGLLVSFLRRHDILSYRDWNQGYFLPSVIGYGLGLCSALVGLYVMQKGQPALLYLVPGTLGTTLVLACRRGEVAALWEGEPCPDPSVARNVPLCKYCPGGHLLEPRPAPRGSCDGCKRRVEESEIVMDCRLCNWYLCAACHPQDAEESCSNTGSTCSTISSCRDHA